MGEAMSRVYLYKRYERFWHWAQVVLILSLVVTGFEVHGTLRVMGFENAVRLHEACGLGLVALTVFTMFWHWTTGEEAVHPDPQELRRSDPLLHERNLPERAPSGNPHPGEEV
jgi:cytochrome b561